MKTVKKLYPSYLFKQWIASSFLFFISCYQVHLSGFLGGACCFYPSCSQYAKLAFKKLPVWQALCLVIKRICRCRPFSYYTYDPLNLDRKN